MPEDSDEATKLIPSLVVRQGRGGGGAEGGEGQGVARYAFGVGTPRITGLRWQAMSADWVLCLDPDNFPKSFPTQPPTSPYSAPPHLPPFPPPPSPLQDNPEDPPEEQRGLAGDELDRLLAEVQNLRHA